MENLDLYLKYKILIFSKIKKICKFLTKFTLFTNIKQKENENRSEICLTIIAAFITDYHRSSRFITVIICTMLQISTNIIAAVVVVVVAATTKFL